MSDWREVEHLAACAGLACVYLEQNPIAGDVMYRKKVMLTLPRLKQLDATLCRA